MQYRSLDVKTFERYIERDDVVLVDVRTAEEFAAGHIEGVDHNIDVRSATFFQDYRSLPKDKRIAVYCKGGGRSKQVAGVLAGNGYKVAELAVGYDGWVKAGGATEK
jgi:rhodanese-related sulfurtransferase